LLGVAKRLSARAPLAASTMAKPRKRPASDGPASDEGDGTRLPAGANPYLEYYREKMAGLPADVKRLFDPALDDERRDELDAAVCAVVTEEVVSRYAWAVPDERALRIIAHVGAGCEGILEIGAGSGYWAALLRNCGVSVVCTDKYTGGPDKAASGKRKAASGKQRQQQQQQPSWTCVLGAGPELCKKHMGRALLLVYPDDFECSAESVALKSLDCYAGSTVIHVGELFGSVRLMEHPWGRSSGDEFQVRLNNIYHKVLEVPVPSWPFSNDRLTVWRRKHPCITDDGVFGYVPPDEELDPVLAIPSMSHLL